MSVVLAEPQAGERELWGFFDETVDPPIEQEEAERREFARYHMRGFVQYTYPLYKADLFHDDVCNHIDRVVFENHPEGHIQHLMLFSPPQHGKSHIVSFSLPAFWLAHNPNLPVLLTSYGTTLARRNSLRARSTFETEFYSELYQMWGIVKDKKQWRQDNWNLQDPYQGYVFATGLDGPMTGHGFGLGVIDDPIRNWADAQSETIRENAWQWYHGTYKTRMWENHRTILMMCMVGKTRVMMADGTWRYLDTIIPGEKVKSWKDSRLVDAEVTHFVPQGKRQVFEVKTGNHKLTATANHPFYVLRDKKPEWVRVDELQVGDRLVALGRYEGGENPRGLTVEDCWALGFMFGDGWLTYHPRKDTGAMRWKTCVAAGMDEALNQKIVGYFNQKFNIEMRYKSEERYYTTESARVGRWVESLGLVGIAKTKRIPNLVFSLPLEHRHAFIDGLIDSDGHINKRQRAEFNFTSQFFAMDLRLLANSCGFRVTNLFRRHGTYQPPGSPEPIEADSYNLQFSTVHIDDADFSLKKVKSISLAGVQKVYDLTVADTHNFIAEGVVVKNTRWHEDDVAARIIENEGTVAEGGKWTVLAYPALAESQVERDAANKTLHLPVDLPDPVGREEGEALAPSRYSAKYLKELRDSDPGGVVWGAEYQQHPTPAKGDFFVVGRVKIEKAYPLDDFGGTLINGVPVGLKSCVRFWDLAASEKKAGTDPDFTSGTLVGIDAKGFTWVLHQISVQVNSEHVWDMILQTAKLDGKKVRIRIEQEPGAAGKSLVDGYVRALAGYHAEGKPSSGDKRVRAYNFSAQLNMGNVRLLEAPWNRRWLVVHSQFPYGKFDDEVDSTAGAFNILTEGPEWTSMKFMAL